MYKRQAELRGDLAGAAVAVEHPLDRVPLVPREPPVRPSGRLGSVSYTHLDVYKRQAVANMQRLYRAIEPAGSVKTRAISLVEMCIRDRNITRPMPIMSPWS